MRSSRTSDGLIVVRALSKTERAIWQELWTAYLEFYETTLSSETIDITWIRLHDPIEPMHALVGTLDGTVVGFVHFLYHRSCWSIGDYCYLQDLYVARQARRRGVAKALIGSVEEIARKSGASRLYWLTKENNHEAQALYNRVAERSGFIQYRKLF